MIQLQDVTKSFGEKTLLEHVTWQVGDRDRVGLCGPNGAGKTTLLKMLAGFDEPDAGFIQKPNALTFGYLPQDGLSHSGRTITAEASLALKPLLDLKSEMHSLEERLGDPAMNEQEHDALLHRYSDVQDQFRLGDGYQIELKVATVLRGLGFEPEIQEQLTDHLSGGWQMRLALAKLLLSAPDLLLLDEPTNHLDLEARNWLEEYLVAYPRSVILVSHDRYFLDAVVTHIADLSLRTITDYHCNYSKYLEERDARLERLRDAKRRQDEEVQRVEDFINRFRYQATKAAQVQSRIKMLEKVERIEVPPERKRIHFQFPASAKSGRMVQELKGVRKAYGGAAELGREKVVLDKIDLHIERGDRIGHRGRILERSQHRAARAHPLRHREAPLRGHERSGVSGLEAVEVRPRLPSQLDEVDEARGGQERRAGARALEERVRRDGHAVREGAHVGRGGAGRVEDGVDGREDAGGLVVRRRRRLRGGDADAVDEDGVREGPSDVHPEQHGAGRYALGSGQAARIRISDSSVSARCWCDGQ